MSIIFRKCCIQGDDISTPVTMENKEQSTTGIDVTGTGVDLTSVDVTVGEPSTPVEKQVPIEPSEQVDGTGNGNHISK